MFHTAGVLDETHTQALDDASTLSEFAKAVTTLVQSWRTSALADLKLADSPEKKMNGGAMGGVSTVLRGVAGPKEVQVVVAFFNGIVCRSVSL